MTKREMNIINSYNNSRRTTLADCYNSYSTDKAAAYDYCLKKMSEMGGYKMRFIGANTFQFSVAFQFKKGNDLYLYYITKETEMEIRVA